MSIKAVVFDYGGVICFKPPASVREEMAALAGMETVELNALDKKYRSEHDRGGYDSTEYYRFILEKAGRRLDDEVVEKIARIDQESWKRLNPATEKLLSDIKESGCKTGILSNMPYDFLPWLKENLGFFGRLDAAVFSCELGIVKPERGIYEALAAKLDCAYKDVVFFDDMQENIDAAVALGIQGSVWQDADLARAFLCGLDPAFSGL